MPEYISVTGLNNMGTAQIATSELTTISVPHRYLGKQAAKFLFKMIYGRVFRKNIKLDVHFKI